jgi:hypothetical protein
MWIGNGRRIMTMNQSACSMIVTNVAIGSNPVAA